MFLQILFIGLSMLLTLLFFLYGYHIYFLLSSARHYQSPPLPSLTEEKPSVAIHLPIYNEKYVIRRLVAACAGVAQTYDVEKVQIVIIDDSDDDTVSEVDRVVEEHRRQGLDVDILRRHTRNGYKAGALQAALECTHADFIAVFDADFKPPPDFLVRTIPFLQQDAGVGLLQTRWTHLNREYNSLTKAISIGIDVHFLIDQPGRFAAGCFQNFNGSAGILRTRAMREAGGWQTDTLAEDLDISYRVQLKGYRFIYLRELQSPGEVPPTVPSFKKQQARWACGSLRTARKLLPSLMAQKGYSLKQRLEAFIHLTGYMVHPLMFTSYVLTCLATLASVNSFRLPQTAFITQYGGSLETIRTHAPLILQELTWISLGLMILICTIAAWVSPIITLKVQRLSIWHNVRSLIVLFLLGCGVSLSNTIEAAKALLTNRNWSFKRTPKYALQNSAQAWRDKKYQVPLDFVVLLEILLIGLGFYSIGFSILHTNFGVLIILIPFTAAYGFVASLTLHQSIQPFHR